MKLSKVLCRSVEAFQFALIEGCLCVWQALKLVGVKAHTEHDKRQVMLDLYLR